MKTEDTDLQFLETVATIFKIGIIPLVFFTGFGISRLTADVRPSIDTTPPYHCYACNSHTYLRCMTCYRRVCIECQIPDQAFSIHKPTCKGCPQQLLDIRKAIEQERERQGEVEVELWKKLFTLRRTLPQRRVPVHAEELKPPSGED